MDTWKNKVVLVSGAGGFIGRHMAETLIEEGASVVALYHKEKPEFSENQSTADRLTLLRADLSEPKELRAACERAAKHFNVMIHCAGLDGNAQFKLNHAAEIMSMNTSIALNVLNLGRDLEIPHMVLLSSAEIYGAGQTGLISEEDDYRKYPVYTTNGYVLSKLFTEITAELYSKQFGMRTFLPRLGNVYGPGDHFGEMPTRVIPSMIHKLSTGQQIDIWGDGKQRRQFIYVKDAVRAIMQMVENESTGPVNIATKESASILELATMLAEIYGRDRGQIKLDLSKPSGASERELRTDKMYDFIDFSPVALRDGLAETVNWHRQKIQKHA